LGNICDYDHCLALVDRLRMGVYACIDY
jgi:hypothetical protein